MNSNTMAQYIDHTLLKPDATGKDISRLCDEAAQYRFASVCLNPVFVPLAVERLKGTEAKICTVIGFPLGAAASAIKSEEARVAVAQGAGEIDMVMWVGGLKEGNFGAVSHDIEEVIRKVREVDDRVVVKVIIETCLLTDLEKADACRIAAAAGADFVKTSTGFSTGGATIADVGLMSRTVGPGIGVKASGGIRNLAQALDFIRADATRIGTSSGVAIIKELGEGL